MGYSARMSTSTADERGRRNVLERHAPRSVRAVVTRERSHTHQCMVPAAVKRALSQPERDDDREDWAARCGFVQTRPVGTTVRRRDAFDRTGMVPVG